jgi:Haem-binding domain
MKVFFKRFFMLLLVALVAVQFIRPAKNISTTASNNGIEKKYAIPTEVSTILKTSCYDCHSNNTAYPWYNNIQPVASYLANHVNEGKRELNFDEFATYRIGRQYKKLEEISSEIEEGEMPMTSYTLIHGNAKLNDNQKKAVYNWVAVCRDSIKAQYPADSLVRKPRAK